MAVDSRVGGGKQAEVAGDVEAVQTPINNRLGARVDRHVPPATVTSRYLRPPSSFSLWPWWQRHLGLRGAIFSAGTPARLRPSDSSPANSDRAVFHAAATHSLRCSLVLRLQHSCQRGPGLISLIWLTVRGVVLIIADGGLRRKVSATTQEPPLNPLTPDGPHVHPYASQ